MTPREMFHYDRANMRRISKSFGLEHEEAWAIYCGHSYDKLPSVVIEEETQELMAMGYTRERADQIEDHMIMGDTLEEALKKVLG